jgi:hypothetical protein
MVGWAASLLIDIDHYAWFVINRRRLDPLAAVRFFNQAEPPEGAKVRFLHGPIVIGAIALLGTRWRSLYPVAAGMAAHAAIDAFNDGRLKGARLAALRRDGFRCQECGAADGTVKAHQARRRRLLPSYDPSDFVALCGRCHVWAHSSHTDLIRPRAARAAASR